VTATQAPTPGPLTAAIDMLSEARDFIDRFSDVRDGDYGTSEPNAAMVMVHEINATIDQISAPTAPVEASGSEREFETAEAMAEAWSDRVEIQRMVETTSAVFAKWASPELLSRFRQQMMAVIQQAYIEGVAARIDVLRPQPSGGTREDRLSAALIAMVEHFERVDAAPEDKAAIQAACEVWAGVKRDKALSTTPARAEAQDEGAAGERPEKWSGPCTVGNMIANLRTLPPEMPIYTAYHIPMDGEPSLLRVKRPTMSRERVDGITIKTGDENVPYSAVIWTQPQDPLEARPSPTLAADADRVREEVARVEVLIEDLTYAAMPTKPDVVTLCGSTASQARDDLRAILAALKSTAAKEGEKS